MGDAWGRYMCVFKRVRESKVTLCAPGFLEKRLTGFIINVSFSHKGFHFSTMRFRWVHHKKDMQLLWAGLQEETVLYAFCMRTRSARVAAFLWYGEMFIWVFFQPVFPHGSLDGGGGSATSGPPLKCTCTCKNGMFHTGKTTQVEMLKSNKNIGQLLLH